MASQWTHLLTHTYFSIHFHSLSRGYTVPVHLKKVFFNMRKKEKAAFHTQRFNNPISMFFFVQIHLHAFNESCRSRERRPLRPPRPPSMMRGRLHSERKKLQSSLCKRPFGTRERKKTKKNSKSYFHSRRRNKQQQKKQEDAASPEDSFSNLATSSSHFYTF